MTIGVLDKDSAPQTISTTGDALTILGALNSTKEINPDAASATQLSLIRGLLQLTEDLGTLVGALTDSKEIDPDAASASLLALIRGQNQLIEDGIVTQGTASAPSTEYLSTHARTTGQVFSVFTTPTVTGGAYSADDVVGAEQTLADAARVSGNGGIISRVGMFSEGGTIAAGDIEVFFFISNPGGTYTDNGALAITDADGFLLVGSIILDTITDTGDGFFLSADNVNIPYTCSGSTSLFAVAVTRNAAFAPDATTGIGFVYGLLRD